MAISEGLRQVIACAAQRVLSSVEPLDPEMDKLRMTTEIRLHSELRNGLQREETPIRIHTILERNRDEENRATG